MRTVGGKPGYLGCPPILKSPGNRTSDDSYADYLVTICHADSEQPTDWRSVVSMLLAYELAGIGKGDGNKRLSHVPTSLNNGPSTSPILSLLRSAYSSESSIPRYRRWSFLATTPTVPAPENGSMTTQGIGSPPHEHTGFHPSSRP